MTSYDTPLEVDTRPIPQLALRAGLGSLGSDVISLGVGHASEQDGYPSNAVPWEQKTGLAAFWVSPSYPESRERPLAFSADSMTSALVPSSSAALLLRSTLP